ncbi:hypothetical protein B0H10DRAFT_1809341 [Mycena sp. CBHHK59/15]|nr:hypothetical protein B0H10DRAFT_1809341 [Mycena sp. CBHHK59/15]
MSLKLNWDGKTYMFFSRSKAGQIHNQARMVERIKNGVYLLEIGPRGGEMSNKVILKLARGHDEIKVLETEAGFYEHHLTDLRGKYVPEFYGIYHGDVLRSPMACMLLEYCTGPKLEFDERNRKVMVAACAVHSAGLLHGDLLDGHHFVTSGREIKIVDFSNAAPHRCYSGTPTLLPGRGDDSANGCPELVALEATYGIFSGGPVGNPVQLMARRLWASMV